LAVIKEKFGERIDGWVESAVPFLLRRSIDPNLLSVLGVLISLGGAFAFGLGSFFAGGILILAGGFFDLVDGVVARRFGRATTFGAFLDSTLDRLVDMAVLLGILMFFAGTGDRASAFLAGFAMVASVLVSYAKARAERYVPSFGGGVLERGERIVLLALGGLTGWMRVALWVVAVGAAITVAQRFALAYREMTRLDASAAQGVGEHP
jgi:CDP-diacylglycerol--glycerol-3-phosphate 3-phosphatidyltransferase